MKSDFFLHFCTNCLKPFAVEYFVAGSTKCPFCEKEIRSCSSGRIALETAIILGLLPDTTPNNILVDVAVIISSEELIQAIKKLEVTGEEAEFLLKICHGCQRIFLGDQKCSYCENYRMRTNHSCLISCSAAIALGILPASSTKSKIAIAIPKP